MNIMDRIRGGLYGTAVGDALGGTTEFMTRAEIRKKYGRLTEMIGEGVWDLEPGEVTDDTMMSLCVAEGILASPEDPMGAIGERFLDWYRSDPKDIGNIIRRALQRYEGDWLEASFVTNRDLGGFSAGNGSLMRCLPAALIYTDRERMETVTRMQSKMTHWDERCSEACVMYNRMAYRLLQGEELGLVLALETAGTPYAEALGGEPDCGPTGYVVDTFRWVLYILNTTQSFVETVQEAANLGGDTDTIGAIAGGLAGVHYGYGSIPEAYAGKILVKERLDELAERVAAYRREAGDR